MGSVTAVDPANGRKFTLDDPDDLVPGEPVNFLLSLHGGGSAAAWHRLYFPAFDHKEAYRLVIATPQAAVKEPVRLWTAEADDQHLRNIVEAVFARYGRQNIRSFWLVGHSQGGANANRLLMEDDFFKQRVDGWLSLSGGRLGAIEPRPASSGPMRAPLPATAEGDNVLRLASRCRRTARHLLHLRHRPARHGRPARGLALGGEIRRRAAREGGRHRRRPARPDL